MADGAIFEICRLGPYKRRLYVQTLIECLVEYVFVSDQFGQILNFIILSRRCANDAVAQCHVMLDR